MTEKQEPKCVCVWGGLYLADNIAGVMFTGGSKHGFLELESHMATNAPLTHTNMRTHTQAHRFGMRPFATD